MRPMSTSMSCISCLQLGQALHFLLVNAGDLFLGDGLVERR